MRSKNNKIVVLERELDDRNKFVIYPGNSFRKRIKTADQKLGRFINPKYKSLPDTFI